MTKTAFQLTDPDTLHSLSMQTKDPTLIRRRGIIDDQGRIRPVGKEDDHHQPARHNNSPFSVHANQSESERISTF